MHSSTNRKHHITDDIIDEYNSRFEGYPCMQLEENPSYILKKCKEVNGIFSQKWNPQEMLHKYIDTFSHECWKKLPTSQKLQHSLTECSSCPSFFPALTRAFPSRKRALSGRNAVHIAITARPDLQMPPAKLAKKVGQDIVTQLEPTCKDLTGRSLADLLQCTPTAGVTKRKTPAAKKKENRDRLREVKHAIESDLHKRDHDLLFQNRLSFRKYNSIRLVEAFETHEEV